MTQYNFYHLTHSTLERALFNLLQQIYNTNLITYLYCQDRDQLKEIDKSLWSLGRVSFLPHATIYDQLDFTEQPILLSDNWKEFPNNNNASILINLNENDIQSTDFSKILYMFDNQDEYLKNKNRDRWQDLQQDNNKLIYYQQNQQGNWVASKQYN